VSNASARSAGCVLAVEDGRQVAVDHAHAPFVTPRVRGMRTQAAITSFAEAETAERVRWTFRLFRRLIRRTSSGRMRLARQAAAADRQRVANPYVEPAMRGAAGRGVDGLALMRMGNGDHAVPGESANANE
jgi:hypothetical protein